MADEHEPQLRYAEGPSTSASAFVPAPAAAVWAVVTDIDLPARFSDEFQGAEWLDDATAPDGVPVLGARFRGHNRHPRVGEWASTSFVVELDPERAFGWAVSDPVHPAASWRFTLEPDGDGTRLTHWVRLGPAPSGLTPAIEAMPDKEHRIIERRLAEHRANMQAVVDGVAAVFAG